jgi:hypothetical protein
MGYQPQNYSTPTSSGASCSVLDLERYDVPDDLGARPKLEPADELLLLVRTDEARSRAHCVPFMPCAFSVPLS